MSDRVRGAVARVRALVRAHPRAASAVALVLLMAISYRLRSQALWAKLWIDEGLSIGIARHDLLDIPSVLEKDGAPPLYYLLLHGWMQLVGGDGEARTHAFSLLPAVLAVPAAWWAGRALFGTASGWAAAALTATLPFLTYYAQEVRMYALVALLGLIAAAAFALTFALRRRRALPLFVLAGVLVPYTHNWGLFFLIACGAAWLALTLTTPAGDRRALVRDGVIAFVAITVLYAPWIPTMLGQAASTGAPWATRPDVSGYIAVVQLALGSTATALAIGLVGGAGLLRLRGAGRRDEPAEVGARAHGDRAVDGRARAAWALLIIFLGTILLAWLLSQLSPAWAGRYVAVVIGPAMLLAGAGLVRMGRLGLVALLVVLVLWYKPQEARIKSKSDAFRVAHVLEDRGLVRPGDTIVSVHPEYGPVMRYYLRDVGDRVRWADALGPVDDPWVFDWRDALERFERTGPRRALRTILPGVLSGRRIVLVLPIVRTGRWSAPWTRLVRRRSAQWQRELDSDRRFTRVEVAPKFRYRRLPRGVRTVVYQRR